VYLCYLDESGTTVKGDTSHHFVYAGIAIPAETWADKDREITAIKDKFGLTGAEIHTGWVARKYVEQVKIPDFAKLDWDTRKAEVKKKRIENLSKISLSGDKKKAKELEKNYAKTKAYVHLTFEERSGLLSDVLDAVSKWDDARVFFHSIRKEHYDTDMSHVGGIYEDAFRQLVSRIQMFLLNKGKFEKQVLYGILISDNNDTMNQRLTKLMMQFHESGTHWRGIPNIVETPLFVDSSLTGMIQIADVIAYSIRRFFDSGETNLFDKILPRVDSVRGAIVGGRHHTPKEFCNCKICKSVKANNRVPNRKNPVRIISR